LSAAVRTRRSETVVLGLALAGLAACTSPPTKPAPAPAVHWGDAGRVLGGRVATVELAGACARLYPALAPSLLRALADWQWRNDALAVEVEDAMWRAVRARGASEAAVSAGVRELRFALDAAGVATANDFAALPSAQREPYCRALPDRLLSGDEDLARRYPVELRAWHPAAR
jgi:hypothetical protein